MANWTFKSVLNLQYFQEIFAIVLIPTSFFLCLRFSGSFIALFIYSDWSVTPAPCFPWKKELKNNCFESNICYHIICQVIHVFEYNSTQILIKINARKSFAIGFCLVWFYMVGEKRYCELLCVFWETIRRLFISLFIKIVWFIKHIQRVLSQAFKVKLWDCIFLLLSLSSKFQWMFLRNF